MVSKRVLLPEGVQDLLIDDCVYRRYIEDKLMAHFSSMGYMEVSSPTLEYYDIFSFDDQDASGDQMFKLIDTNGRLLVLRPDCTIPIARMVGTKMKDFIYPLKLSYVQNVFRIDEEQAGKKREFRQAGVEIFGVSSYKADVEIIVTAIENLKHLGVEDVQIDIGQVKILKEVFENIQITEEQKEKLIGFIENKNFVEIGDYIESLDVAPNMAKILKEIPRLFGSPEEVLQSLEELPLTEAMKVAKEELAQICRAIDDIGLGDYISIDLGMVARLEYYTGIIFKGFTKSLGVVLLSGGRYNQLMENFGLNCPATGFAFVINKITKALKLQEKLNMAFRTHYLVIDRGNINKKHLEEIKRMREQGCIVEISLLDKKEEIEAYGKRRKVDIIIEAEQLEDLV
ncbi:ATP phosphoribosyltransferase regulatory subunit [Serpentinicella sp. ANB-PHB4]|uniref:ATP phosphoribosyltransferase regulatory subunit n=1 Tax=Serpentinicella sp. ANB-PHB4 TaxID=3074076 RepID=UPI002860B44D|nr:ATP phosphoribosyltransferase regulatory subunit [Serpentinicella sp. ANB-PHB4]MDR5659758.1 ATP phosphoribosyltransferase regulatory subunit [Serpentinicella sp. ANB-PHB4]